MKLALEMHARVKVTVTKLEQKNIKRENGGDNNGKGVNLFRTISCRDQ